MKVPEDSFVNVISLVHNHQFVEPSSLGATYKRYSSFLNISKGATLVSMISTVRLDLLKTNSTSATG